jgi:putative ABC transport system permease protein
MALIVALIFVILFFCIQTTLSAILRSRQAEIALLHVLGARRKQILWGLTLELSALGLVGGLLGFGLGVFMAQVLGRVLFQTFVGPRMSVFVITVLSSLIMMLLSSILPMMRAVNRQAALVLKEA